MLIFCSLIADTPICYSDIWSQDITIFAFSENNEFRCTHVDLLNALTVQLAAVGLYDNDSMVACRDIAIFDAASFHMTPRPLLRDAEQSVQNIKHEGDFLQRENVFKD